MGWVAAQATDTELSCAIGSAERILKTLRAQRGALGQRGASVTHADAAEATRICASLQGISDLIHNEGEYASD